MPAKSNACYRKEAPFVAPIDLIDLDFFDEGQEYRMVRGINDIN